MTFPQELEELNRVTKVSLAPRNDGTQDDWQWKKLINTLHEDIKPDPIVYEQGKDKRKDK